MPDTQTITIRGEALPIIDMPIHARWRAAADRCGFDIIARVVDRYALALACRQCGVLSRTRLFVLMNHEPRCASCIEAAWRQEATAAGITFLRRDPASTPHAWYRLPCGHEARRQIGLITRVAAGWTGLRCGVCQEAVEAGEAEAAGWELVGPDPEDDTNYRLYRHVACDHVQRIARGNLRTGRFDCSGCGKTWTAAPSFLYLFRVLLPNGMRVLKLGFSKNPQSRLHHQLLSGRDLACQVLRVVAMPTGHQAIGVEKRLHTRLRRAFPEAVIPKELFADMLSVVSEVYADWLEAEIQALLDRIEDGEDDDEEI